ncbi:hypothetical protein HOLleu_42709 [Holothuria leucospilota]|uniref:ZU5 domain-containing protein n=1 Tax=Holothuria leucospilota TaxID=206669 RepID=A0A9Q1BB66_HOLLE|nr:hypothetical protein HOLleu_42709 [Holothuria leucospilota]
MATSINPSAISTMTLPQVNGILEFNSSMVLLTLLLVNRKCDCKHRFDVQNLPGVSRVRLFKEHQLFLAKWRTIVATEYQVQELTQPCAYNSHLKRVKLGEYGTARQCLQLCTYSRTSVASKGILTTFGLTSVSKDLCTLSPIATLTRRLLLQEAISGGPPSAIVGHAYVAGRWRAVGGLSKTSALRVCYAWPVLDWLKNNRYRTLSYSLKDEKRPISVTTDTLAPGNCLLTQCLKKGNSEGPEPVLRKTEDVDEEGKVITLEKAGVTLDIPPGAVSRKTTVTMQVITCADNGDLTTATSVSPRIIFQPDQLQFQTPVKMTLPHCAIINDKTLGADGTHHKVENAVEEKVELYEALRLSF